MKMTWPGLAHSQERSGTRNGDEADVEFLAAAWFNSISEIE
jgi:hypothetical protein